MKRAVGFTLFESLISMLILAVVILSVLALLPSGIQAQQNARYQLYATAMAIGIADDFHNAQTNLFGFGDTVPNIWDNSTATASAPPNPGWAQRLRNAGMFNAPYQFDAERHLSSWLNGYAPVPREIARRLDSPGDEIQLLLDQGGELFYAVPGHIRGLTLSAARDTTISANPPPEMQKLVFAVISHAQQNALPAHPAEHWPWYELYPFPPAWVALGGEGKEVRRLVPSPDPLAEPLLLMLHGETSNANVDINGNLTSGLPPSYIDGGHAGFEPFIFDPSPTHEGQFPSANPGWNPEWTQPIDHPNRAGRPEANDFTSRCGRYHGRNWRYFAAAYGGRWSAGWPAFQRLAGLDDAQATQTPTSYSGIFHRSGWLPVMAMITGRNSPSYDLWNPGDLGGGNPVPPPAGMPKPAAISGAWDATSAQKAVEQMHSIKLPATYEMRANYRDRALDLLAAVAPDLWQAGMVKGNVSGMVQVMNADGGTQVDCDYYEYPPAALDAFRMIDPEALGRPPHPAEVLALSYLAHASMMVTGFDLPFFTGEYFDASGGWKTRRRFGWECLNWQFETSTATAVPNFPAGTIATKDATLLAQDASITQNFVVVKNDTNTPIVFYSEDRVVFEQDYRDWYVAIKPKTNPGNPSVYNPPGSPNLAKCPSYRIVESIRIDPGTEAAVLIDPPLARNLLALLPAIANLPADRPQQIRRIANEHDRAFARKVHETCLRWASRYGAECPQDWGAPRPANHQIFMDKPLAAFDLFYDAGAGGAAGQAIRVPKNLPTATSVSTTESFYRWVVPANRLPSEFFPGAPWTANRITHHGPGHNPNTIWENTLYNDQLREPSLGNDATRMWMPRPFAPFHRARQLQFWSVDWKSYEDAESAPSAPADFAKLGRALWSGSNLSPFPGSNKTMIQLAGNPENNLLWLDETRTKRLADIAESNGFYYETSKHLTWRYGSADVSMGHWGADRNNNGLLDVGTISSKTRMRAQPVSTFVLYDPILRLNQGN